MPRHQCAHWFLAMTECGELGVRGEPLPSPPREGSAATPPPEGEARAGGVAPIGLRPLPPEGEARRDGLPRHQCAHWFLAMTGGRLGSGGSPYRHRLAGDRRRHLPRRGRQGRGEWPLSWGTGRAPTVTASRGIGGDTSPGGGGKGAGRLGKGESLYRHRLAGDRRRHLPEGGGEGGGSGPYRPSATSPLRGKQGRRIAASPVCALVPRNDRVWGGSWGTGRAPTVTASRGIGGDTSPKGEARVRGVAPIGLRPLPPKGKARTRGGKRSKWRM